MNDAVNHSFTYRLTLVLSLGFVALVVRDLVRLANKMEEAQVVEDVELFLKKNRLQDFINPHHQAIVDGITRYWINDSYSGPIRALSLREWLDTIQTPTLRR